MSSTPTATLKLQQKLFDIRRWVGTRSATDQTRLSFVTGLVSALAFAPLNIWPLMIIAFAILVALIDASATPRRAAAIGWWFGFGQMLVGLYWIAISWQYQANMPVLLGAIAVGLLSAGLALFAALSCGIAKRFWHGRPTRIFMLAGCWALGEYMRGFILTGFPWNLVGSAWLPVLPMAQGAALFGTYGLSIIMVSAGGALAVWSEHPSPLPKPVSRLLLFFLILFSSGLAYLVITPVRYWPGLQVHVVQANIGQDEKWSEDNFRLPLQQHLAMTHKAIAERGPGLVIWPETAVPNLIDEEITSRYLISRALGEKSFLLTGGDRVLRSPEGEALAAYNSLMVIDSNGQIRESYDKAHLVPFGEYLPWRSVLDRIGISRLAPGGIDFRAGPGVRSLQVDGIPKLGPLICFEVIFPGQAVDARNRPAWLLNLSNDAWFGRSSGPWQHLAQARLRSIEEGLPMVRSTPTGVSSVIDGHGRLVAKAPVAQTYVLSARLPQPFANTPYGRFGDITFLCFTAFILFCGRRATA
jgi:apolipoprotein N-acyltransferase